MSETAGMRRGERWLSGDTIPRSAFLQASQTWIEGIAEGVSQEIEAKHGYADREAREEDEPGRNFDVLLTSDR